MKTVKPSVHFVDNYLINPTNPVTVSVIGAGGTGSQVATALARINYSLVQLGHAGLQVKLVDNDVVTAANTGRQLFAETEIGLHKSVALINRLNRALGTSWNAVTESVTECSPTDDYMAQIVISCVDTVAARFTIARLLKNAPVRNDYFMRPLYWLDFGNGQFTGQSILSTIAEIKQPRSRKFTTIHALPGITTEYAQELKNKHEDRLPSCSLAEALRKQDLFINSTLANIGCSILWNMFREGMLHYRGFFINLKTLQTQGIPLH
jgi:PRTRC genetic system ThiF family protein